MRHKPNHTCFPIEKDCAGCAFELGELLAKRKPTESAKYLWMVVGSDNPCDIRRYEFTHEGAVSQLNNAKNHKDSFTGGTWTLFKLMRVRKTPSTRKSKKKPKP